MKRVLNSLPGTQLSLRKSLQKKKIRKSRSKKKIRKPGSKKRFLRKRYPDFLQADKTLFDQPVNSGTLIFARKRAASLIENFIDLSSTHLRNSIRIT